MSKLDLSDAFRHVLFHDGDWELLGCTWPVKIDGTVVTGYFFDTFCPFGLRSSPALFPKIRRRAQVCHVISGLAARLLLLHTARIRLMLS